MIILHLLYNYLIIERRDPFIQRVSSFMGRYLDIRRFPIRLRLIYEEERGYDKGLECQKKGKNTVSDLVHPFRNHKVAYTISSLIIRRILSVVFRLGGSPHG